MPRKSQLRALAACGLALACARCAAEPPQGGARAPVAATVASSGGPPSQPSVGGAVAPTMLITDPAVLRELERRGLSLGALLGGAAGSNRELSQLPRFAPLLSELQREIARTAAADRYAGVDVARFPHRLFDARFLRLAQARFSLAGVVNRPDRAPFSPASCGETRLVYRLAYELDAERASKLPMTLGIELQVPRGAAGCRAAAARWQEPAQSTPEARAAWLRSELGPLGPSLTPVTRDAARVVVNLQLVRWPSTVRPDLGGHAEYLLRAFRPDAAAVLRPEVLENTPDPQLLKQSGARKALTTWLGEHATEVDAGTPVLPEAWLSMRAISVTPRGLHRLANRPFSAALAATDVAGRDFAGGALVKSPAGLLRRLDQLSCQGCHQARSVAGFHLLGEDAPGAAAENSLVSAVSPQVLADLPRRLRVAERMLAGAEPDFSAPFAERAADGGYGQACGRTEDPSFVAWTCQTGLECSAIESGANGLVGQCLPAEHGVGDACEKGEISQAREPLRDGVRGVRLEDCPQMVCNRSGVGFPGGMCTAACGAPGSTCGSIAILDTFNACLARGESFLSCVRDNVRPAGLRGCGPLNPCRDDYVCAQSAQGGVCLPPYFVFQLRVDGHSSHL